MNMGYGKIYIFTIYLSQFFEIFAFKITKHWSRHIFINGETSQGEIEFQRLPKSLGFKICVSFIVPFAVILFRAIGINTNGVTTEYLTSRLSRKSDRKSLNCSFFERTSKK